LEPANMQVTPVYECPKCGYNNAGPYNFKRLKA
jgi:hypothetical protein